MNRNRVLAVIPARYSSTRFPGKPLVSIAGKPMVAQVVARAREAGCFDEVLVATDDRRIARAATAAGARPVLTGECRSGTDRVAMAVKGEKARVVINVQGDEPALPPANLRLLAEYLLAHPETPLATLALPASTDEFSRPDVTKVVCDLAGRALFFSRAPIPYPRNPRPGVARKHVGLYGFQREALFEFAAWPESELELVEGLEQLRALQHGMAIQVLTATADSVAVDVPADVPRAEAALAALQRPVPGARARGFKR
ncbi:MAG: 3-deoxy-manno-octulosonate cytidylyltransferase [Thermoanaerobaculales bacterium]